MNTKIKADPDRPFILNTYFQGIASILTSQINHITKIINHDGTKGQANEELLKNLLTRFLPKKYSVGSGIIFDKDGNFSNQIDIVIYDAFQQPEILGQGSQYLFPVDIVYCVIEVKTIMSKQFLKDAIDNIASVKKLNFIRYEKEIEENETYHLDYKFDSISPFTIIFSYTSTTKNYKTFFDWIVVALKELQLEGTHIFERCYIFENTFSVKLPNLEVRDLLSFDFCHVLADSFTELNPNTHSVICDFYGNEQACDKSRGFLIFLSDLLQMLSLKDTYKGPIIQKYFPKDFELQTGDELELNRIFSAKDEM